MIDKANFNDKEYVMDSFTFDGGSSLGSGDERFKLGGIEIEINLRDFTGGGAVETANVT